jgi:hypothetical protein
MEINTAYILIPVSTAYSHPDLFLHHKESIGRILSQLGSLKLIRTIFTFKRTCIVTMAGSSSVGDPIGGLWENTKPFMFNQNDV